MQERDEREQRVLLFIYVTHISLIKSLEYITVDFNKFDVSP